MKILIAGDSFASPYWHKSFLNQPAVETSWAQLLEKTYDWQVTNLAVAGSSLEYSYLKLIKHNLESYDKVIIVVTNPGRLTLNHYQNNHSIDFPNLATAEKYISEVKDTKSAPPEYAVALAVKSYYEYIYNPDLGAIYFEAILKKIIELVPQDKLILINGCCENLKFQHYFHYPVMLHTITLRELEEVNVSLQQLYTEFKETDAHINHLMLENKVILSKVVYDLCTVGASNITLDDFKKMNPDDFSIYYQPKFGSKSQQ